MRMRISTRQSCLALCATALAACGGVRFSDHDAGAADPGDAAILDPSTDAQIDAGSPQFLSCYGLATNCGVGGIDSCCSSPVIAGGTYYRSYDKAGDGGSGSMAAPATLSSFALDRYEVTVGRFRTFVNAGMGTLSRPPTPGSGAHARIAGSGWDANWNINLTADKPALLAALKCNGTFQTWTDTPGANERRPINCVTWYEAMAFCAWDGGYLPTEAEWNYAATGGDQQRAYPWSNPPGAVTMSGSYASYSDVAGSCAGDGMTGCAVTDLVAVGSKPAGDGRWGQSDLAGNVWEWNLDWYAAQYANPCMDCADVTVASNRIIRGGSYQDNLNFLRATYRYSGVVPTGRGGNVGFRCARAP